VPVLTPRESRTDDDIAAVKATIATRRNGV
jgi:hypothetical protein